MVSTGMADQLTAPCWLSLKGWLWTSWATSTSQIRTTIVSAWSTPAGIIHTIAGSGERGFDGDGGPAISALLSKPSGVAVDSVGNVYIADTDNHRIRMVDAAGIIHTIAGSGVGGATREGGLAVESDLFRPVDVAVDGAGNMYIANSDRISKVDISGIIRTFGGTGPEETGAHVFAPRGVAVDAVGNVYFTNPSLPGIRKVDVSGAISTVVELVEEDNLPRGLAVDASGIVYFTDITDFRVYKVDASGALTTIAGLGVGDYSGDGGPATKVKLGFPRKRGGGRHGERVYPRLLPHSQG